MTTSLVLRVFGVSAQSSGKGPQEGTHQISSVCGSLGKFHAAVFRVVVLRTTGNMVLTQGNTDPEVVSAEGPETLQKRRVEIGGLWSLPRMSSLLAVFLKKVTAGAIRKPGKFRRGTGSGFSRTAGGNHRHFRPAMRRQRDHPFFLLDTWRGAARNL